MGRDEIVSERMSVVILIGDRLGYRASPSQVAHPFATMSKSCEATRNPSIPDLHSILDEKLDLGDVGARESRSLPVGCTTFPGYYVGIL